MSRLWLWAQVAWAGPALPTLQGPSLVGGLRSPQKAQERWELGGWWAALRHSSLAPREESVSLGVYIVFLGVHRSTALAAAGRAVFMAGRRPVGGDLAAPPHVPGTRLSPCPLAS